MGTNLIQNSLISLLIAVLLVLGSFIIRRPLAYADTPTATPANPTPTTPNFYDPLYSGPPTSIPDVNLPDIGRMATPPPTPTYEPTPLETPALPTVSLPDTPVPTLSSVSSSIGISYSTPALLSVSTDLTATNAVSQVSNLLLSTQNTISGIITYTDSLSNTIFELSMATDTLATGNAPAWYSPALPRPIADVGWRFEEMGQDTRKRYSVAAWGIWMAEVLAIPVQLVKGLAPVAQLLGPFGLFLAWLLIMAPIVLLFKILRFLKDAAIAIFNFLFEIIKFLISFIPGVG